MNSNLLSLASSLLSKRGPMRAVPYLALLLLPFFSALRASTSDVTSVLTAGTLRNTWNNYVGCQFTTGPAPLTVTHLGRWIVSGQTSGQSHTVEIIDPDTGGLVTSVDINAFGRATGGFAYEPLGSAVTLQANHHYYLLTLETTAPGGDYWLDDDTELQTTSDLTVDCPEFYDGVQYYNDNAHGLAGHCYGPVSLIYNNPSAVTGITTLGSHSRNDYGDFVGFKFTTGSNPLVVTQLGRWTTSGNIQTHTLKLVDAWNNVMVATTSVTPSGATPAGQFLYGSLGSAVTLCPNHSYYLLSQESGGGDYWYSSDCAVTSTNDITINNPEYHNTGLNSYVTNSDSGLANHTYGPLNFIYTIGSTGSVAANSVSGITGAMTGSPRTDGPYDVGYQFTTGSKPLTITQLGRWVAQPTTQTHLLKLYDASSLTTPLISATFPIQTSAPADPGFVYVNCTAATLAANHTYYLFSHEGDSSSGDIWSDDNTGLIPSPDITVNHSEYYDTAFRSYKDNGTMNHGFGPVGFKYNSPDAVNVPSGVGTARNNWNDFVGLKFTVGNTPLVVSHLGRWVTSGNTGSHTIEIVDATSPNAVIASTVVHTSGMTSGQFAYASLDTAALLSANHTYYLLSKETSGGDTWYEDDTLVVPTGDFTIDCGEFHDQGGGTYHDDAAHGTTNLSFGPVSFLYQTSAPTWTLQTADTLMTLGAFGAPVITQLAANYTSGWDWSSTPNVVTLPRAVTSNSVPLIPDWTFQSGTMDTTDGTKLTLVYASTLPSLTLTQIWSCHGEGGPVEETTKIANSSGAPITINDSDVVPADLTVSSDSTATLWRFNRASHNTSDDPDFDTGIFKTVMTASTSIASVASNSVAVGQFQLPFTMLDVGGAHGLYLGYETDFGRFTVSNSTNADQIRSVFTLWNANSFDQADGTSLCLPGMFYGAYTGDTDDGSNQMKQWFYNHEMTRSMFNNSNEPLVEVNANMETEYYSNIFFSDYPNLASWGVQLIKEDFDWTDDQSNHSHGYSGWDWAPDGSSWPSGMTLASLAHGNGVQLDLYMGSTYLNADLATSGGVAAEQAALEGRYSASIPDWAQTIPGSTGFDYWRTDFYFEADNDYLSHLGFMAVLDYMITNHSGFRWENCSAGGSKKSFDLLRRQSDMCVEDSGEGSTALENYRIAFYANSYMINPVQLEAQNIYFTGGDTPQLGNYNFRTGMMGAWMSHLRKYPGGTLSIQDDLYAATVPIYTSHQRPILRGANVYHVLPIPDRIHWDGIEYFNPALNKGSVLMFKPNSSESASPSFKLKGLNPAGTYTLKFADRGALLDSAYVNVSGSYLMTTGIAPFAGTANDYDSEIIWINY